MYTYRATVVKVIDGDTLDLRLDLGLRIFTDGRFRLAGIDAPERGTPEGTSATNYVRDLLPPESEVIVTTVKDSREKYGRWLAWVTRPSDAVSVNQLLIDNGHAQRYDGGKRERPDAAGKASR